MRYILGILVAVGALVAGLLLGGAGHDWGVVLIIPGLLVVLVMANVFPEPRDLLSLLPLIAVVVALAFVLEALGAPEWLQAVVLGAVVVAWIAHDIREKPGGLLRIPPGYRFRSRR